MILKYRLEILDAVEGSCHLLKQRKRKGREKILFMGLDVQTSWNPEQS